MLTSCVTSQLTKLSSCAQPHSSLLSVHFRLLLLRETECIWSEEGKAHILQHFIVVDVAGEMQWKSGQEGVVSSISEGSFQHDGVPRAKSKVRLLTDEDMKI